MIYVNVVPVLLLFDVVVCAEVVGKGYNIMYGNPDGVNPISGGQDPGIMERKIIENEFPKPRRGNQARYCEELSGVDWYYGGKEYQNKLFKSIQVSGDGNYDVHKKAFLSSSQYIYMKNQVFSNFLVVQEIHKTCIHDSFHQPLYNPNNGQYSSVTDDFAAAVCSLSSTYVAKEYRDFIETWGTHVVFATEIGTKEIKRYQISDISLFEYVQDQVPEAIFPTGNKDFRQKVDFRVFNAHPMHSNRIGAYLSHFFVGNKDLPQPISMKLVSIDMVLQRKFWERLNKYIMGSICSESTTIDDIIKKKSLVVQALQDYSKHFAIPTDTEITVPIVWPEGTYALLKASRQQYSSATCPSGVKWDHSSVSWCTDSERNDWSQSGHFVGHKYKSSIKLQYCVKRDNGGYREALRWPKGNYCLTKYRNCPSGFSSGYVHWKNKDISGRYTPDCIKTYQYAPDGHVDRNGRKMEFCCRDDGYTASPIALPRDTPFYLVRNNNTSECQQVKGMLSSQEYITWDNGNITSSIFDFVGGAHPMVDISTQRDITMHFCYYHKNV